MLETITRVDGTPLVFFSSAQLMKIRSMLETNDATFLCIDSTRLDDRDWKLFAKSGLEVLGKLPVKNLLLQGSLWKSYEGLRLCPQLEWLDVSVCLNFKLDLSPLDKLTHLELVWSKQVKGLSALRRLESLRILKLKPPSGDLSDFAGFSRLRSLTVTQSNIKSIRGIEALKRLTDLTFTHSRSLSFATDDCRPMPQVRRLRIEKCPMVGLSFVKMFPNVVELDLFGQPEITTLKSALKRLMKLRKMNLYP